MVREELERAACRRPSGYLRLALSALARRVLSEGSPPAGRTALCRDRLTSVEINGSFYALQRPGTTRLGTPRHQRSSSSPVKGPRFISHMKKLHDVDIPLANFYASGVLALREKLGPILWQLPPNLGFDPSRLAQFFAKLPRTTFAAALACAQTTRSAWPAAP